MQDGCKVCMDSYMASNGSCFMVAWIVLKNDLFEVGVTQNQETMAHVVNPKSHMLLMYSILSCVKTLHE